MACSASDLIGDGQSIPHSVGFSKFVGVSRRQGHPKTGEGTLTFGLCVGIPYEQIVSGSQSLDWKYSDTLIVCGEAFRSVIEITGVENP